MKPVRGWGLGLFLLWVACSAVEVPTAPDAVSTLALQIARTDARVAKAFSSSSLKATSGTERAFQSSATYVKNARIPLSASEPLLFGPNGDVSFRLLGAAASSAVLAHGRVTYRNALPSTDLLVTSEEATIEQWFYVRSAPDDGAKTLRYSYAIEKPEGWTAATVGEEGSIAFSNPQHEIAFHLAPPYALDANGVRRSATWQWTNANHTELALDLDTRGLTYPLLVDPSYVIWLWTEEVSLTGRGRAAAAYDAARGKVIMFGGARGTRSLSETWSWDGTSWTQLSPAHVPPARTGHSMAYDATRQRVTMYGGSSPVLGALADTWTWDGTDWIDMRAANPGGLYLATMAFDATNQRIVMFGGLAISGAVTNSTWLWNGTTWTRPNPATRPSARAAASSTWDAANNVVVLIGGDGTFNDTWTWNGTTWTQRANHPERSSAGSLGYLVGHGVVSFGGLDSFGTSRKTYVWNGSAWSTLSPTNFPLPRWQHAFAVDTATNKLLIFGGHASNTTPTTAYRDTWSFDGTNWSDVSTVPNGRYGAIMAFDAARDKAVLFGGVGGSYLSDTWTWAGAWTRASPATSPPATWAASAAYDEARSHVVMFGGFASTAAVATTWTWNGNWNLLTPASSPPARYAHAMAYDSVRSEVVLFGGRDPAARADTWVWNGIQWTEKSPTLSPLARYGASMAFDRARGSTVLFGGRNGTTMLGDTWTWDGTTWTENTTTDRPEPRTNSTMAYDGARERLVLLGGETGSEYYGDAWSYNGSKWETLYGPFFPPTSASASLTYIESRRHLLLFGGRTDIPRDGTFTAYRLGDACTQDTDCPNAFCNDGVCCERKTCSACSSCNAAYPGTCIGTQLAEDPDTCPISEGKSCSGTARCRIANGFPTSSQAECASGFLADGVCCETDGCDACQTCNAADKERNEFPGRCGAAKAGTDPKDNCAAEADNSCGRTGTCDGRGACTLQRVALRCGSATCDGNRASGQLCDGAGTCALDVEGKDCAPYVCGNGSCGESCTTDEQCVSTHRCEAGKCVQRQSARCIDERTVETPDGTRQTCGKYQCRDTACLTSCENLNDCVFPNQCNDTKECVAFNPATNPNDGGGCSTSGKNGSRGNAFALFAVGVVVASGRRRRPLIALLGLTGIFATAFGAKEKSAVNPAERALADVRYALVKSPDVAKSFRESTLERTERGAVSSSLSSAVRLPQTANGPTVWGRPGASLEVRLEGATRAPLSVREGCAIYPDAFESTDVLATAQDHDVEQWMWLKNKAAPTTFSYRVHIDGESVTARETDGRIALVDRHDHERLTLAKPFAIDARGERREAKMAFYAPDRLQVSLDAEGLTYPVLLDPSFTFWNWSGVGEIESRYVPAMAYDPVRARVVMFGGSDLATFPLRSTYEWDGAVWTEMSPTRAPSARVGASMVYDQERARLTLFGGGTATATFQDTWTWSGTDWTQIVTANSPEPRAYHRLAYDPVAKKTLLFGGGSNLTPLTTWLFDGTNWTQATPTQSPAPRFNAFMEWDPSSAAIILFGGYDGSYRNDMWQWTGTNWSALSPLQRPSARIAFGGTLGPVGPLLLFGGYGNSGEMNDTWTWSGTNWMQATPAHAPPARYGSGFAFDAARGSLLMMGGSDGAPTRETWAYTAGDWVDKTTIHPLTYQSSFVVDESRNERLLFGGVDGSNRVSSQCWIEKNGARRRGPNLTGSAYAASAFDASTNEVVSFGGLLQITPRQYSGVTQLWNGEAWTDVTPTFSPSARAASAVAFDAKRNQVVLYGGADASGVVGDTWVWSGATRTWTLKAPAHSPPPLSDSSAVYDRVHEKVVVFGGVSSDYALRSQTWLWDGTDWTEYTGTIHPSERARPGFSWDAIHDTGILYGGAADGGALSDTWEWDGIQWARASFSVALAARRFPHFVADNTRGELALVDGLSTTSAYEETWTARPLGTTCLANGDCPTGRFCTDGVCCVESACATCETCAGTIAGRCGARFNQEDPDTCAAGEGKICDKNALCKKKPGERAASAGECSTGFLVDGVCCNTVMCGACNTCDTAQKENAEYPGECGPIKVGTDPRNECTDETAASCGHNGTCDGLGACAFYPATTACGESSCDGTRSNARRCNGVGTCREVPSPVDCAPYACSGGACLNACATDIECVDTHRCDAGRCISRAGGSCDGDHTIVTPEGEKTDCGAYKCEGAKCKTTCVSVLDCVSPAECNAGECVPFQEVERPDSGCATSGGVLAPPGPTVFLGIAAAAFGLSRRRRQPRMG